MPWRDGLGFLVILNESSELRFEVRRSYLCFRTWARPVQCGLRGARTCSLGQWVKADDGRTVSIEKLCLSLSLSPRVEKSKLKEGNKSFVPEPRESSVFRDFRILMRIDSLWTYVHFTSPNHRYVTYPSEANTVSPNDRANPRHIYKYCLFVKYSYICK